MKTFRSVIIVLFLAATVLPVQAKDIAGKLSGTLKITHSPYHVKGDIIIPAFETLIIPAGVTIKFDTVAVLEVRGALKAVGSKQKPIVFTSGSKEPKSNDWKGIYFTNSADNNSILKFCRIEYARTGVRIISVSPTIENCEIKRGEDNGILIKTSRSEIIKNIIMHNKNDGILAENFKGKIEQNVIADNGDDGIDLRKSPCIVRRNEVSANHDDGIVVNESHAEISFNTISKNGDDGILVNGDEPIIAFNGLIRNIYGVFVYGKGAPLVQNNTIVLGSYGIYLRDKSSAEVINTIIWDNATEIFVDSTSAISVHYSDVNADIQGKNNLKKDPKFVSEEIFQLLPESPCIGKADVNPPFPVPQSLKEIIGAYGVKK